MYAQLFPQVVGKCGVHDNQMNRAHVATTTHCQRDTAEVPEVWRVFTKSSRDGNVIIGTRPAG